MAIRTTRRRKLASPTTTTPADTERRVLTRIPFVRYEKVWVHDDRFPHALRRATVAGEDESTRHDEDTHTVETGLGGKMTVQTSQMHHLEDNPPVAGCSHCAADPDAATSSRG